MAAIICTAGGHRPRLFLKSQPGTVNGDVVIKYLKELKKHLKGRKLLLFWDGLPAHRAKLVQCFLKAQMSWLKVIRMPAYAPELNPPEYLWSAMKAKDVGNLRPEGLSAVRTAVRKGYRRIRRQPNLLIGFLKASELF